jgi:hypothetical protein
MASGASAVFLSRRFRRNVVLSELSSPGGQSALHIPGATVSFYSDNMISWTDPQPSAAAVTIQARETFEECADEQFPSMTPFLRSFM